VPLFCAKSVLLGTNEHRKAYKPYFYKAAVTKGFDWSLRTAIAHETAWSIEIRITPKPNAEGADVNAVF
jgi:hypothetical protein